MENSSICSLIRLTGHSSLITKVAFSPNGDYLASASWDNTIKLWKVPSGEHIKTLRGHKKSVSSVVFSPNKE